MLAQQILVWIALVTYAVYFLRFFLTRHALDSSAAPSYLRATLHLDKEVRGYRVSVEVLFVPMLILLFCLTDKNTSVSSLCVKA